MIEYQIFYSWQNDSPKKVNRTFIKSAIERAAKNIYLNDVRLEVLDADRITVDEGLEGVPGSPEVASIMFDKIEESAIFVGDVSLVGQTKTGFSAEKQMPNSNVLIEEGYAAAELGWSRVVCVINEYFGTREMLPFDMKNRRFPIAYKLSPDATDTQRLAVKSELVKDIEKAIKVVWGSDLRKAQKTFSKLDVHSFELAFAYSKMPSFSQPLQPDSSQKIVALKDHEVFRQCVLRFLDLGIVQTQIAGGLYAYHWTFLGREVIKLVVNAVMKN